MTTYELATSVPPDTRKKMASAGLMPHSVERYIYIYECYQDLISRGHSKMSAYDTVSRKCYTCVENVRKIIQRMNKPVK